MYYKSNRLAAPLSSLEDEELSAAPTDMPRFQSLVGRNVLSLNFIPDRAILGIAVRIGYLHGQTVVVTEDSVVTLERTVLNLVNPAKVKSTVSGVYCIHY